MTVHYNYFNDILANIVGTGPTAQAQFGASISVKDQHGHEVDSTPTELASALAAPPNGFEVITSGTNTATLNLFGLTAGDVLSLTITGQSSTSAVVPTTTATPEPASLGLAGAGVLFGLLRRRLL